MPRSARGSDEDTESKTGRRTRMLNARAVVDSPVRRSSRIKQSAKQNKSSPESPESDTSSISNSQPTRITRQRTSTMDPTIETLRGRRTRQTSMSSDISETTDVDVVGTPKKVTRRSLAASVGTPTRTSSRTTRNLARAGSEGRSPPLLTRTTRRTRATSADPETMSEQSKSQPSTPAKVRRRASVAPSGSPVKEEVEENNGVSSVLMSTALIEVEEFASSGNTDSSPDKAPYPQKSQEINEKRKSVNGNKIEDVHDKSSSVLSISDEICQLSEKMDEVHSKHVVITTADKNEFFGKEGNISEKNVPPSVDTITGETSTHDTSFLKYKKANEAETESNLAENEQPPNDTFKNSAAREIGFKIEHLLNISGEEKRKSSSNKENQVVNVINETLTEKNVGPIISNVTSLSTKHLTSTFVNKSLNEKEIKSVINEASLSKRRRSRESTESTAKYSALPNEIISIDSSSPQLSHSKTDLDRSLLDGNRRKKHSMLYDDNELTTTNINKSILSKDDDIESVDKITDKNKISVESVNESDGNAIDGISILEEIHKTEEITIENEISNQAISNEIPHPSMNQSEVQEINDPKSSSSLDDNNEIELLLEEQDTCQDENKLHNNSSKPVADCDSDHLDLQINVEVLSSETRNNASIENYEQSSVTQSDIRDNLPDSIKQSKKDSSDHLIEMSPESSNAVLETINSTSNDLSDSNEVILVIQSSNATETSQGFVANMSSDKAESKNILLKTAKITNLKSTNISNLGKKEKGQKDLENRGTADNDSDVDIGNLFQDIPAAEWREKITKKSDNIVDNPHSDSRSMEKPENESEAECDLVLVDKQAWLAAESMKVVKENQCFDFDSDDTVVLKSRLDAIQSAGNIKKLDAIKGDLLIDESSDEEAELIQPWNRLIKRRSECAEESDSSSSANTSLNKSKNALNRSNKRAVSTLNKSKQALKASQQSSETYDESDEPMDMDELNRFQINNKHNTSIRKSTGKRESLNEFSKDTSSKQDDQNAQSISANRSQADDFMENTDNITPSKEQSKPKIKKAFNKSMSNEEADTIKSKKNLSSKANSKNDESTCANRSVNKTSSSTNNETEPLNRVDLESDSSEVTIPAKKFDPKKKKKINYSTVAHVGSTSDDSNDNLSDNTDSSSISEDLIPSYFFASNHNDSDSDSDCLSIDSDIKREYNLDGTKQKLEDDDVPGDECRASELEFSDSDDNGSDLADFIVDDEVEVEEEVKSESDEEDEQNVKQDEAAEEEEMEDIDEDEQDAENDDDIMEKKMENVDEEQTENADEEQIENAKKESNKMFIKKNASGKKSVKTKMSTSSNIILDGSFNVHNIKDMSREHNVPSITEINKRTDVKANKSCTKENETTSDRTNLTPSNKKRKSDANKSSSKDVEQDPIKQPNKPDTVFKRRLSKLYSSMECSTPKSSSFKQKFEIDVETSEIALDNQDKQSNNAKRYSSSEKKKTRKDSTSKEDVSLKEFKRIDYEEKLRRNSLPSDLKEIVKKVGLSKPAPSKRAALHNTMNVTHTETPTIRFLRKEKLNESAPVSKLKEETRQLEKNSPDKKDITQTEVKKKKASDWMVLSNNDNVQESNQRKQKKRKKRAEEKSAENIIDEAVSENMIETNIPKKKKIKRNKLGQVSAVENDACKDAYQANEKGKKKKQVGIIEKVENANEEGNVLQENIQSSKVQLSQHGKKKKKDIEIGLKGETLTTDNITKKTKRQNKVDEKLENVNEANVLQKDIQTNKMQLRSQHGKKKKKNVETSLERADNITKKAKRQNKAENKEAMAGETLKRKEGKGKKKDDTTSLSQTVLKSKSEIDPSSQSEKLQLQNIIMSTKSENIAFTKARDEALRAIKRATEEIKLREKLKKKKQREDRKSNVEKQVLPSSTCGLKRLPSDVLDNLSDVPTRAKKRQKLLQNEEKQKVISSRPITSSSKFLQTGMKNSSIVPLSSCGSTTQFAVVNLENVKKQSSKIADEKISFRQRMLNKNDRQHISSYLVYRQKQRATSSNRFPNDVL